MINNYGRQSDFVVDTEGATPDGGFYAAPAQYDMTGMQGLMGGGASQPQPNAFASQTPGAPSAPNRINEPELDGEQEFDFMQMLSMNIAKSFGG
jgi:hypothetical protein